LRVGDHRLARHLVDVQVRDLARHIERHNGADINRSALDRVERHPTVRYRRNQNHVSLDETGNRGNRAGQAPPTIGSHRGHATVRSRRERDRQAGGAPVPDKRGGQLRPAVHQRGCREYRAGQERNRADPASELLHHHRGLALRTANTAELGRYQDAR
jgi:hypothetical protein